ncbi:MAG: transposase [candidate division WOR-3 bacterium]|nr:transposase [candidate division WOR-3 bacterium]
MKGYRTQKVELKRFNFSRRLYFITSVTENRKKVFETEHNIKLLLDTFRYYKEKYSFDIVAYCILPDHFHWLVIPSEKADISQIMKGVKGFSTRKINQINHWNGRLWQHQFLDHIIRKDEDYRKHINYIHNNPVKHGLVEDIGLYPWSSYRNYYLEDYSLLKVDKLPL